MRKPMKQYTWEVTTDVLWTSSKFRRTISKSRHTKAPKCERDNETCEDGNEQKYRDFDQEVKEAELGMGKVYDKRGYRCESEGN